MPQRAPFRSLHSLQQQSLWWELAKRALGDEGTQTCYRLVLKGGVFVEVCRVPWLGSGEFLRIEEASATT